MSTIIQNILHFLFPVTCASCGINLPADDYFRLCAPCQKDIKLIDGLFCTTCGTPLPDGGAHCFFCRKAPRHHYDIVRSAAVYEGRTRKLLHSFKYEGRDYLGRVLGRLLVYALQKYPELCEVDAVIPVPVHWFKKLRRGYNQSELLARPAAAYLQKELLTSALFKERFTRPQVKLPREERLTNLSSCFAVYDPAQVRKKSILLIDDVCTTGSTIDQCAKVLKKSGALKVYGLTVARD